MQRKESFLSRWSRLKKQAEKPLTTEPVKTVASEPKLPPIEQLDMQSDYSVFFHPKVEENLRRQALRKLFSDPHFNAMDGLDVYIDDYGKPDPIPPEMLAQLLESNPLLFPATGEQTADQLPGQKGVDTLASEQAQTVEQPKKQNAELGPPSDIKPKA